MNTKNSKGITGNTSEEIVSHFLTSQGWNVFRAVHHKGMADIITFHEDHGTTTYQVKTLTRQGGKHVATNGLVMEGERPRIVIKLTDGKRYYRDYKIDWIVGVEPDSKEMYFYPFEIYSQYGSQLTVNTIKRWSHPKAPELKYHTERNQVATLEEVLV